MTTKQSMRPTKPVSRGSSADSAQQHPKPPFPAQHQTSPGLESKLKPRPQYQAAKSTVSACPKTLDRLP